MSYKTKGVGLELRDNGVFFNVWAPFAESVEIIGTFNDWAATKMEKNTEGYHSVFIEDATPGQEYKFVIDTGTKLLTRNDPMSLSMTSTSGNSVIPGPLPAHRRKDDFKHMPNNKKIIYEIHIGTFNRNDPGQNGTFESAADRLTYLKELGVNTIEVMPIHSMYQDRGWGYAPEYIYAVESSYGGRNHFADFVEVAHQNDLAVVLDVVYNHLGSPEQTDLWQFDGWSEENMGGIYFYNDWRATTPWGNTRPDFGRVEIQDYISNNAKMWTKDFKVDGLRLDSTIYMRNIDGQNNKPETDIPEVWTLFQKMNYETGSINENKFLIAEDCGSNDHITKKIDEGGAGFNAQWDMEFASAIQGVIEPLKDEDRNIAKLCIALNKKFNGDAFQRIIFSESHDTAANGRRRLNEQISPKNAISTYAKKKILLANTILLTAPGIPMLLQGQEIMQSGDFNDWQAIDWQNVDRHRGLVLAHKHLIALRKNTENLTSGLTGNNISIIVSDDNSKILAYRRWDKGGISDDTIVLVNLSNRLVHNYYVDFPHIGEWKLRFDSSWHGYSNDFKKYEVSDLHVAENGTNVTIPPYTALIYSQS